ncbi:MAG TPA: tetratricopeptide repeat protein [Pseudomonadales bacterium]
MSLLMEALRKAEQAKQRMQQHEGAARSGLDAPEIPSGSPSPLTLEEREPGITPQYIRDNFTAVPDADPGSSHDDPVPRDAALDADDAYAAQVAEQTRHVAQRQRAAAASVFAAKQQPAHRRRTLTLLVTIMLLMIPVGGGILWYLQAANSSSIGLNPALANYDLAARRFDDTPTAAATAAPGANVVAAAATDAAPQDIDAAPAPIATDDTGAAPANDGAGLGVAIDASPPPAPASDANATPTAAVPAQADAAAPVTAPANANLTLPASAAAPVLEVSRSRGTTQVNPDLAAAYAHLQDGDIAAAGSLYRQVLATLPNNRDALLGLALVHMREGQDANARELYARLLELNPRDPLAHTGLLQTVQSGSPAEHENALKALIGQFPNVAQLTLALGNHYASQGRWSEAQAAYYNALLTARRGTNGPVHPDYAFNLAVSLEQLNQPQAALDYYRQAQALAAEVTPGFDPQLLDDRLDYLLSEQSPR